MLILGAGSPFSGFSPTLVALLGAIENGDMALTCDHARYKKSLRQSGVGRSNTLRL